MDKGDIVSILYAAYNDKTPHTEALVLCLPKISIKSSSSDEGVFEATLPCQRQSYQKDTLPWTLTIQNFTVLSLTDNASPCYICKPLSCKVFLAASSNKKPKAPSSQLLYGRDASKNQHVMNIGFVIHADWTSCELLLCKSQVNLED